LFKNHRTIEFKPDSEMAESIIEAPSPSRQHLTEEYKRLHPKINKTFLWKMPESGSETNLTVKSCIPFIDALTSGYMITLPCDIIVTRNPEYKCRIYWDVSWEVITTHNRIQMGDMATPEGYEIDPFKFETEWVIKTPPGYSVLITHPLNRFDLPFMTMSGIVDTDNYNLVPVNLPFFLKNNFEGVIKKGTPIAQIIIIKREDWNSKKMPYDPKSKYGLDNLKSVIEKSYKNRFWVKKKYE
jgi:hypothetical protein